MRDLDAPHTLDDDFGHFLDYQNWRGLPAEEIARLRTAYEHGSRRGVASSPALPGRDPMHWDCLEAGETP